MKSRLEELEEWGTEVIFGRARGFRATMMRIVLRIFSWAFKALVKIRLALFAYRIKQRHDLGAVIISIGNITVGGTGKTPVTELLAKSLVSAGRKVAILSRGYKSHDLEEPQDWKESWGEPMIDPPKIVSDENEVFLGAKYAGDEPHMLALNLPGVAVVVDRDRVKAAKFAIDRLGADTLLLDDGMQYIKLGHELDVVLVDTTAPFGTEALLPRGTLREPPSSLSRASYIVLTKCSGSSQRDLIARIRRYNRVAEIIETTHGPKYLQNVYTGERQPLEYLKGKCIASLSGIARPESFENSLVDLGANLLITKRFTDHHWFDPQEIEQFMERCADRAMEMIVTTEKDAVRFPQFDEIEVPVWFLRIEVDVLQGHRALDLMISRIVSQSNERRFHEWN